MTTISAEFLRVPPLIYGKRLREYMVDHFETLLLLNVAVHLSRGQWNSLKALRPDPTHVASTGWMQACGCVVVVTPGSPHIRVVSGAVRHEFGT